MKIKKFLNNNIKNISEVNRNIIEFYTFDIIESNLKCTLKKINKKRIIWEVRYLGEKNKEHPQGKWQVKRGETIEKLVIYLKKKGVKIK